MQTSRDWSFARRDFLKVLGGSFCLAAAPGLWAAGAVAKRPNIILCMTDDQGWGDTGYNGHPALKTPELDAMADAGLVFDRFYASSPVCSPTRGSVMTGRHPNRFGCFNYGHWLRPEELTLPEALKPAGYVSGHFGKWHIGPVVPGSGTDPGASGFDTWLSAPNYYDNDPILSREGTAVQLSGESSMVAVDAALDFIDQQQDSEQPFLAVIWFGSPHRPHSPAREDLEAYQEIDEKKWYGEHRKWLAEIGGVDRAMGKLRAGLRERQLAEDTMLWFNSDNGGLDPDTTGGRGKKGDIYEGGLRVPAIVEWAGHIQPGRTSMVCSTSDIYPTLLDVTGVTPAHQPPLDGISLKPLLAGQMAERPAPLGFWHVPISGIGANTRREMRALLAAQQEGKELPAAASRRERPGRRPYKGHAAWLDWPWKLHRIELRKDPVRFELYNLASDPQEANDLVAEQPDRLAAMTAQLNAWLDAVNASEAGQDYR